MKSTILCKWNKFFSFIKLHLIKILNIEFKITIDKAMFRTLVRSFGEAFNQ